MPNPASQPAIAGARDYGAVPPNAQRRPENAMSDEWTREFLTRARIGHVATRWDDQPFTRTASARSAVQVTPTNFWYDPGRDEIYFHEEKRRALYGLPEKYFPGMRAGEEYRPITDAELKRASVYAIAVSSWSGKRNWPEQADQSDEWPPLAPEWLAE